MVAVEICGNELRRRNKEPIIWKWDGKSKSPFEYRRPQDVVLTQNGPNSSLWVDDLKWKIYDIRHRFRGVRNADLESEYTYFWSLATVIRPLMQLDFPSTGWSRSVNASFMHPTGAKIAGHWFGPNTIFRFDVPKQFGESFQKNVLVYLFVRIMLGMGPCPPVKLAKAYLAKRKTVPKEFLDLALLFGVSEERLLEVGAIKRKQGEPWVLLFVGSFDGLRLLFNDKAPIRPGTLKEFVANAFAFENVPGYDSRLPKKRRKRKSSSGNGGGKTKKQRTA